MTNDDDVCTFDEQKLRIDTCKACDNFTERSDRTTWCKACDCSLSLLITFKSQVCPEGKW